MPNELQTREQAGLLAGPGVAALDRPAGPAIGMVRVSESENNGLLEISSLLWKHRLAIVAFAALGTAAGLLAASLQPALYQAKTLVEIQDLNEGFLNMQEVSATGNGPGSMARADLKTHVKLLGSRSVTRAAAERVAGLTPAIRKPESLWAGLPWFLRSSPQTPEAARDEAIRTASESLQILDSDGSRTLEVVCDSTDSGIAAGFANAVVEEFIGDGLRTRWESARQTERWLNGRLADARANLEHAEGRLRAYVQKRGLFVTPEQLGIEEDRLRQLQQALSRASEERAARQSRHELAGTARPEAISEVLDDSALREYQAKLVDLRRQYAELSSLFTDEHHRVKQVLAQIRTIEPVVEQERADRISRIHNEFEAALRREKLLAEGYREQKELVLKQADVAVEYNMLDREVQTARQIYETLLRRVKEAGIASAMAANPARIVDRATAPEAPYKPNPRLSAAMGLLSGAFVGVVFAFLREQGDHRLKQPGDAARYLGAPELGVVFKSAGLAGAGLYRGSGLVLRIAWSQEPAPTTIAPRTPATEDRLRVELGAWHRKQSRWAECFRAARTSILFHAGAREGLKSLVITSPCPGEGKSTIACNLAIAMAETGRRTLLVDFDLRRPRLHEVFGIAGGRGVSDLLQQEPHTRFLLDDSIRDTRVAGLCLLPSGALNGEGPALVHSARTAELLRELEREFDFVVLDTPPLLPVADARVLARFAGAAVMVLRLNDSTREQAQLGAAQLVADGSRLLGVVLNGWKPHAGARGYYSGRYEYAPQPAAARPKKSLAASA